MAVLSARLGTNFLLLVLLVSASPTLGMTSARTGGGHGTGGVQRGEGGTPPRPEQRVGLYNPGGLVGWGAARAAVVCRQALLQLDSGLPADASKSLVSWIRGVVTVSGVFLLTPLVDTYVNTALQLTRSDAWQLSPLNPDNCSRLRGLRGLAEHDLNFLIAVADHDSPSFKEQSRAYAEMLRRAGWGSVAELSVSRSDHMKIVADLSDASNSFSQNLLKFIKQCNSH